MSKPSALIHLGASMLDTTGQEPPNPISITECFACRAMCQKICGYVCVPPHTSGSQPPVWCDTPFMAQLYVSHGPATPVLLNLVNYKTDED